jgi:type III pantothenate kinase
VVDVGNSQIELGIFHKDELKGSWRIATGGDRTEDEFMVFIDYFLRLGNIKVNQLEGVAISSVVPNLTFVFKKICNKYLNLSPLIVDHTINLGLKINYKDPAAVGADRLCNAVAAFHRYNGAVVVIDFGTATTFDIVNSKAEYLGGIISAGVESTAWALYQRAAKLPKISLEFPDSVIGNSTETSMQSGILLGTIKMIDGMLKEIFLELEEKPRVISTGGLANLIRSKSKIIEAYYPHLVLEGLNKIYSLNSYKKI